ncbi:MAG: 30S ribosome-binding factor RbfA [Thermoleophilia bacterium]|nr:30S ribosome-binding factor RbfA [Thermoleophilia bacterium]MBJ7333588.1 30S ribosome-binding factor RbfA [Thermoleophilia bacterium]
MKRGGKERGRRIDGLLREVISEKIARLSDPRLRGVTVVEVRASKDTAVADVFVQLHGSEKVKVKAIEGLEAARPVLQGAINAELSLRNTPVLRFINDQSIDRANRIDQLLQEHAPSELLDDA